MDLKRADELIKKYAEGTASQSEEKELMEWYRATVYKDAEFPREEKDVYNAMLENINRSSGKISRFDTIKKWTVAASLLFVLGAGATIYFIGQSKKSNTAQTISNVTPHPGGNRATLTLANGKKILLTDAANGKLASENGIQITKAANGQLIYKIVAPAESGETAVNSAEVQYNTIETPAGGQYQVLLPDGSKIWLNALSSIRFPLTFYKLKERLVELKGEAYFDVVHNAALPFKVISRGMVTEDIGTSFNIKAYDDEPNVDMTLVQGSARVTAGANSIIIKPGEQASYTDHLKISNINVQEVIAWKNGYFKFQDKSLEDIMKVISRWYNIEYVFKDQYLRNETYGAMSTRFENINTILNIIEQTGNAKFSINGNKITIARKDQAAK
jgi:transmembrane sensor